MKLKEKQLFLKGKSIFIFSLIVIGVASLTVFLTGENYHRSVSSNLYLSLSIIAISLFLFMTFGLYKGIGLIDNFPKFRNFKKIDFSSTPDITIDMPDISIGDGIGGLIISVLVWIAMSILFVLLLVFLEALFWVSIFIIFAMLYWVFFRALKFVFKNSDKTKGDFGISTIYSLTYTILYVGWIYGVVFLTEALN